LETKKAIRQKALKRRNALSEEQRKQYSDHIAERLYQLWEYDQADCILIYAGYQTEAATDGIILHSLQRGKEVYCPRVTGDNTMEFFRITSLADLEPGYRGIREPVGVLPGGDTCFSGVRGKNKTLMIMPLTAFDTQRNRIGYGKGFYDRYLKRYEGIATAALAFEEQRWEAGIPAEPLDIRPDSIITPARIYMNSKGGAIMLEEMGKKALNAKEELGQLTTEQKNNALRLVADGLTADSGTILDANALDIARGQEKGMNQGLLDRLTLTEDRIAAMAEGIRQVADLPDPIGEIMEQWERPNGLKLEKKRVPLGVIGIIYESRPNVTADAFALCFKTGNAVILKGGKEAISSNLAIVESIQRSLVNAGVCREGIQLVTDNDRETTMRLMKLNQYIDVLIPRGGAGLIGAVVNNSTIPVIETGTGNCHIYVDKDADINKAINIIINAKTQRISVCNACESLVVHERIAESLLPALGKALREKQVEIRGDETCLTLIPEAVPASEEDYGREYLDYILSVKTVKDTKEAVEHINHYHTGHSDCIVTENNEAAQYFLERVDSACVYHNASTRFTDGFEFGFGAEIGISTQKLHARGPMGLKELTSYKYIIRGNGQVR
jgi:glutamate-5-semialdehyde dehydrogenase